MAFRSTVTPNKLNLTTNSVKVISEISDQRHYHRGYSPFCFKVIIQKVISNNYYIDLNTIHIG